MSVRDAAPYELARGDTRQRECLRGSKRTIRHEAVRSRKGCLRTSKHQASRANKWLTKWVTDETATAGSGRTY